MVATEMALADEPVDEAPLAPVPDEEPHILVAPPKLNSRFITQRENKDFVVYGGLLDLAHQMGRVEIIVTPIQFASEENGNKAIMQAEVFIRERDSDRVLVHTMDIGDASPGSTTRMILPHVDRMASTRAKGRALRDAVNIGSAMFEELGGPEDDQRGNRGGYQEREAPRRSAPPRQERQEYQRQPDRPNQQQAARAAMDRAERTARENHPAPSNEPPASEKQLQTIQRMARAAGKNIDTDGMTRAQASKMIEGLIGEMGKLRNQGQGQGRDDAPPPDRGGEPEFGFESEPETDWDETIENGGKPYTRRQLWNAYEQRRAQAIQRNLMDAKEPPIGQNAAMDNLIAEVARLGQVLKG